MYVNSQIYVSFSVSIRTRFSKHVSVVNTLTEVYNVDMATVATQPQTVRIHTGDEYIVGEIIEYAGQECKVSKNGALYGYTSKGFITPPGPDHALEPVRTSEQGRELASTRWHAPRQKAAIAAVAEAAGNNALDTIELADGYMVQAMISEVVLNPEERGADRIKAWEAVLEHSGMSGKAPKQAQQQPAEAEVQFLRSTLTNIVAAAMAAAERKQENG